jgi:chitinase
MRKFIIGGLILLVLVAFFSATGIPTVQAIGPTPTFIPPGKSSGGVVTAAAVRGQNGHVVMGYYTDWSVYGAQYFVKNLVTSGAAAKITHINLAFGGVDTNGNCYDVDPWADYQMGYTADNSVDGSTDPGWTGWGLPNYNYVGGSVPAQGVFHQLQELKAQYPKIKVIWSIGGWTLSSNFGVAAASPAAAASFALSCYNLLHQSGFGTLFDGIDIDWEYPNACGNTCDTSGPNGVVTLMTALRVQFGPDALVTEAVPAGTNNINAANFAGVAPYVNWFNVMTYDYFGPWATNGPTAPVAPLFPWPGMPTANGQGSAYIDSTINQYLAKGVPANKMLLGLPFYGYGWTGVAKANGGLNQTATGLATDPGGLFGATGTSEYHSLITACPPTGLVAGEVEAYCNGNWWAYETPGTISLKMVYKILKGLGGTYFWDFSGDSANGALVNAISRFNN